MDTVILDRAGGLPETAWRGCRWILFWLDDTGIIRFARNWQSCRWIFFWLDDTGILRFARTGRVVSSLVPREKRPGNEARLSVDWDVVQNCL